MANRDHEPRGFDESKRDWTHRGPDFERGGPEGLWQTLSDRASKDRLRGWEYPYWKYGVTPEGARGHFYGRGPKGYRRSDERIREEICDRLTTHPDVDASDIEVQVERGVVRLSGLVDDRHQKRIADFIADDALGVDDVNNELKVRHGFWAKLSGEAATDR